MQIEIDFDVFKALTAMRQSEADSYNAVLRRLLSLPVAQGLGALSGFSKSDHGEPTVLNALARNLPSANLLPPQNALLQALGGAWFSNTHFPEGTQFRATYKGRTYLAEIRDGQWVGQDGRVRNSPSEAAGAISGTNVNGWKFWHAKRPGEPGWTRIDELKQ